MEAQNQKSQKSDGTADAEQGSQHERRNGNGQGDSRELREALPAPKRRLRIVVLGLSLTSSWGNGHATTYRALLRALNKRGHSTLFLERDAPWYAKHRDLPAPAFTQVHLYDSLAELKDIYADEVRNADLVIVGSYVMEGVAVGRWVTATAQGVTAFYDIDTPVTLTKLDAGDTEYISADLIPHYDLYLSFAGGSVLEKLENVYQAQAARPLYCSVDASEYRPEQAEQKWTLGYMGTYSEDRQPGLEELLLKPATAEPDMRFSVAGPNYPAHIQWPTNIQRIHHLPPPKHRRFYNQQRFTLNLTRSAMISAGHSPSVRLFEATACGTPIISDYWRGLETFFAPDSEILIARNSQDVQMYLHDVTDEERQAISLRAQKRVLNKHTALHRAYQLEQYVQSVDAVPAGAAS